MIEKTVEVKKDVEIMEEDVVILRKDVVGVK